MTGRPRERNLVSLTPAIGNLRLGGDSSQKGPQIFNLHRFDEMQIEARRASPPPVLFQPIARQRSDKHRPRIWQHPNAARHFITIDARKTNIYEHRIKVAGRYGLELGRAIRRDLILRAAFSSSRMVT